MGIRTFQWHHAEDYPIYGIRVKGCGLETRRSIPLPNPLIGSHPSFVMLLTAPRSHSRHCVRRPPRHRPPHHHRQPPRLAASTPDEYIALAVRFAQDLPRLANLRATLRERVSRSPLMDAPRFTRHFEHALRTAWHNWCDSPAA